MRACVRECVRACVRTCGRTCVCGGGGGVRACVCVCVSARSNCPERCDFIVDLLFSVRLNHVRSRLETRQLKFLLYRYVDPYAPLPSLPPPLLLPPPPLPFWVNAVHSCQQSSHYKIVSSCYLQICRVLQSTSATRVFDEEQRVPYVYQDDSWFGYEDVQSLQGKVGVRCSRMTAGLAMKMYRVYRAR